MLMQDLGFPGIEKHPNVQGGSACIVSTRIPVWVLVMFRKMGTSDAELLLSYPSLSAEDLANTWAYYAAHRDEIDGEIAEQEAS